MDSDSFVHPNRLSGRLRSFHGTGVLFSQAPESYGSGRYGFVFSGPRIHFCATGDHISKHLSSVLGWTELCHEVPESRAAETPNHP